MSRVEKERRSLAAAKNLVLKGMTGKSSLVTLAFKLDAGVTGKSYSHTPELQVKIDAKVTGQSIKIIRRRYRQLSIFSVQTHS